VEAEVRK